MKRNAIIATLAVVILIGLTASATAYLVEREDNVKPAPTKTVVRHQAAQPQAQPQPQPQRVACNDGNIAGKVVGGVGGGVVGSMLGKGNGKTATTIGGTLGGAYLGGEVLPLQNVTCAR